METYSMPRASHPLQGQMALVTGSSKGIGRGIADRFVEAGANVVLVARGLDELERTGEELRARCFDGQFVETIQADLSEASQITEIFDRIDALACPLDIAVANCGSGKVVPFLDIDLADWQHAVDLNLTGTFLACQQAGRRMRINGDRPNRSILVISSIRALGARPGRAPYSATKAALNQMVRVAAQELAEFGIRVNALSPGITATPLTMETNPEVFAEAVATVPLGTAADPIDMGAAALYLCSAEARFVTGANLVVDGGESLW